MFCKYASHATHDQTASSDNLQTGQSAQSLSSEPVELLYMHFTSRSGFWTGNILVTWLESDCCTWNPIFPLSLPLQSRPLPLATVSSSCFCSTSSSRCFFFSSLSFQFLFFLQFLLLTFLQKLYDLISREMFQQKVSPVIDEILNLQANPKKLVVSLLCLKVLVVNFLLGWRFNRSFQFRNSQWF